MCGLDSYPGIKHGKGALDMIERFVKDKEASWTSKKGTAHPTSTRIQEPVEEVKEKEKQVIFNAQEVSQSTFPKLHFDGKANVICIE